MAPIRLLLAAAVVVAAGCAGIPARRLPPDPTRVYTLAEVDSAPRLTNPIDVMRQFTRAYPAALLDSREVRVAVFAVEVGTNGRIQPPSVLRSTGSAQGDSAMLRVLSRTRFTPARIDSVAVRVRFDWPIEFGGPRRPDAAPR